MDEPLIIHPQLSPEGRVIAVSDIHGNLSFFSALMDKIALTAQDSLILVGDMIEKGKDSLALLRRLMELSHTHRLYPLCGNCDGLVLNFFETDALDGRFFSSYLPQHPESTIRQLAREGGFEQLEDLPRLRRDLRSAYPEEWAWLKSLPTILETDRLVFVHGGVPSLEHMEKLNRWRCMKNDDFLSQGHSFDKWVVVGHWPVTLYNSHIPSAAPMILPHRKIASIDGGCVLKADGQLNALILSSPYAAEFSWTAWDGLPTGTALDSQTPSRDSLNIRWGRSALELLEPGEELSWCRHVETGRELWVLNAYLRQGPKGLWCEDSTDYRLPVAPGDRLTLVWQTQDAFLCKKDGVTGWYFGRITDIQR